MILKVFLVLILFKFKKCPNISGIRVVYYIIYKKTNCAKLIECIHKMQSIAPRKQYFRDFLKIARLWNTMMKTIAFFYQ